MDNQKNQTVSCVSALLIILRLQRGVSVLEVSAFSDIQAEISSTRSALHEVKESLGGVRADLVQVGKERRMKWQ